MRNTFSKSEDAVTIRALASQRQIKPVLSPPKGMSGMCSRLSETGQTCALASRPRRGRMSITAGVVSEANETCGPPECGMIVLEEGEHKGHVSRLAHSFHLWTCVASTHGLLMFALFEDGPLAYGETAGCVRFALSTSGYGYSPPSATLA